MNAEGHFLAYFQVREEKTKSETQKVKRENPIFSFYLYMQIKRNYLIAAHK